jgi:hypothetical protein
MKKQRFVIPRRISLFVLLTGLCALQLRGQQFQVINVSLLSSEALTRTHSDDTYRIEIRNTGRTAIDVTAGIKSSSRDTTVVDTELEFGDIPAGQSAVSKNTLTIRQNKVVPFRPSVLLFQFRVGEGNAPPIANAGDDQM